MIYSKFKSIKLLMLLCIICSGTLLSAQAPEEVEKTELELKQEQEQIQKEKRAKIEEKRKASKRKNERYLARQQEVSRQKDKEMFEFVGMEEKQIEKYNKLTEDTRAKTKDIMQKGKSDPAAVREELQKIRDQRSVELKSIFKEGQFDKYMEFNEMKASKNRRSKHNNIVKKVH